MLRGTWARWCAAATSLGSIVVQGLALAGHGQWGFPWSPADLHDARATTPPTVRRTTAVRVWNPVRGS